MNLLIEILTAIAAFLATQRVAKAIRGRHRHDWDVWVSMYPGAATGTNFYHRFCRTCGKPSKAIHR